MQEIIFTVSTFITFDSLCQTFCHTFYLASFHLPASLFYPQPNNVLIFLNFYLSDKYLTKLYILCVPPGFLCQENRRHRICSRLSTYTSNILASIFNVKPPCTLLNIVFTLSLSHLYPSVICHIFFTCYKCNSIFFGVLCRTFSLFLANPFFHPN